ncbi:MAG: hypothetical protein IPN84_08925 [Sphingomonadales bacterium]|nr:hypothetical protein [Sphingomonadales bacterium]
MSGTIRRKRGPKSGTFGNEPTGQGKPVYPRIIHPCVAQLDTVGVGISFA